MPSYYEIMQINLSTLIDAADGWKAMADKFKKLEDVYEKEVQGVASGNSWTGESALSASAKFRMTRNEFDSAQKEARAMESLLRDAHGQFTELKGRVKSAVTEATGAGMKVSDQGIASYDFSKVDAATANSVRHDPDLRDIENSYTKKIMDAVKSIADYDLDVKAALLNASGADGTSPFGFNSKPVNDVEAIEALALTDKINSGNASAKELERYNDLLRQNSDEKHFSEAYLNSLGAKDTLLLADRMNLAANERDISASDKKLFNSINAGLADTVASGTKDPGSYAYRPFMNGLKAAGDDDLDGGASPTSGYRVLVTLMSNGEGYGKEFLNEVGDDMIKAEKSQPNASVNFYDPSRPNLVADPLDGLLNIMSKQPDASTYFLDPEAQGNKNDHLEYLLTKREWPDSAISAPGTAPIDMGNPYQAAGLGAAIEAASTGHEPGGPPGEPGPHSEGQARVMHNAIRLLDDEMGGDEFPKDLENLRQPMARALTDYVADTHIILGGQESAYGGSSGNDGINGSGDKSHLAVGQGSLIRIMRGIADDAPSYSLLYETERAYSAQQLAEAPAFHGDKNHGSSADWDHRGREIGVAMGAFNGIGADVYKDKMDDRVEWAEDTSTYSSIGANGLIGEIPFVGTAGGALIDSVAYDWTKDVVNTAEDQGKKDSSGNFSKGVDGTNALFDGWREKEKFPENHGAFVSAKDNAGDGYDAGRGAARAHLQFP
ncbi:hypothetical protein ACFRMN_17930 [Streptomyces sp. NPDC056835]|uniref:hypothetical protein n=1 Tax=Streptomyces sp. NPDC056835 TaxID=3345956 RepID=UPI0036C122B7